MTQTSAEQPTPRLMAVQQLGRHWPGRAMIGAIIALVLWTWWGAPPPLTNTNAGDAALQESRANADARAAERNAAVAAASEISGPRGDFEKRGVALRDLPANERASAAAALAADARLLERVAAAAAAERTALRAYDDTLMARTRDLGPRAEELRSATWPIVEHLKLYPPPIGTRSDWSPPDETFLAERAAILDHGDLDAQIAAAIEIGRSTYGLQQLRELDATYRSELDRYALLMEQAGADAGASASPARIAAAALTTLLLGLILLVASANLCGGRPDGMILFGGAALLLWYLPAFGPAAIVGAGLLVAALAVRPGMAALLPLAAIPLYYRPRTIGGLSFPLNETLIGWIVLALLARLIWEWARRNATGGFGRWRVELTNLWRSERILIAILAGLATAGLLSLLAPPLVDLRVAARELRRTIAEPAIWAGITAILLRRNIVRPKHLLWAFILPAAAIAGDSLIRFALGQGIWASGGVPRLIGLLPSSTALGAYLGAALAGGMAFALAREPGPERLAARLLCLPLACGVALTFTRGAWLGCATAALLVLAAGRRWRIIGSLAGAGAVGLGLAGLLQPARLAQLLRLGEGTGAARREIWAAAGRAIGDSPWLGLGLDQFSHVNSARYGIPQIRFLTLAHPHNLILDIWLQLGLAGLLVLGTLVWLALRRLWRAQSAGRAPGRLGLASPAPAGGAGRALGRNALWATAALAMLTDLIVHGMLDQTLLGGDLFYLWWALALIALNEPQPQKIR